MAIVVIIALSLFKLCIVQSSQAKTISESIILGKRIMGTTTRVKMKGFFFLLVTALWFCVKMNSYAEQIFIWDILIFARHDNVSPSQLGSACIF